MVTVKKVSGSVSLPRYFMPDASESDYLEILNQVQECPSSQIGNSYFYIRTSDGYVSLCRIIPGAGKVFFHEIVDHQKYGISDEDIEKAIYEDQNTFTLPGHHPVSSHIEMKLHAFLGL